LPSDWLTRESNFPEQHKSQRPELIASIGRMIDIQSLNERSLDASVKCRLEKSKPFAAAFQGAA